MACILCQKYSLFCCCKPAANDEDFFSAEKLSVTGGAVSNSVTAKISFAWETDHPWMGTCCKQDPKALVRAFIGGCFPDFCAGWCFCFFQAGNLSKEKFRSEMFRLFLHDRSQLFSTGFFYTWIIYHFIGNGDLAAKFFLLDYQNTVAGAGQI